MAIEGICTNNKSQFVTHFTNSFLGSFVICLQ